MTSGLFTQRLESTTCGNFWTPAFRKVIELVAMLVL